MAGNTTMLIFLGKNMLGQADKIEYESANINEDTRNEVNNLVDRINNYKPDEGNGD